MVRQGCATRPALQKASINSAWFARSLLSWFFNSRWRRHVSLAVITFDQRAERARQMLCTLPTRRLNLCEMLNRVHRKRTLMTLLARVESHCRPASTSATTRADCFTSCASCSKSMHVSTLCVPFMSIETSAMTLQRGKSCLA